MKAVHNAKKGWFISSKRIKLEDQHFRAGELYPIIEVHKNGVTVLNEKREPSIIIFTLPCEHLEEGYEWDLLNNKREFRHIFPLETDNQPQIQKEKSKIDKSKEARKKTWKETAIKDWKETFKKNEKDLIKQQLKDQVTIIEDLSLQVKSLISDLKAYENKTDEAYKEQEELAIHAKTSIFGFSKNIQAILKNTGVLLKEDIEYMEQITIRTFIHQTDSILNPVYSDDSNE